MIPASERAEAIERAGRPDDGCPKHMVYGPCGGVRADERCEVDGRPCPFVHRAVVRWSGPASTAPTFADVAGGGGPVIVTDLRVRAFDPSSIEAITTALSASADVLLIGEHSRQPDFPPTVLAALVASAGGRPWVTLTCRDRNRVVLESELAGLGAVGAVGVHCVTGDSRSRSIRDDATQVFDLDGTRLAALAAASGLCPSVAATPVAPPVAARPDRVLEKQRAGAQVCFVNHAGGSAGVEEFVGAARTRGVTIPFVPCVPVVTDVDSLLSLERFPGVVIDPTLQRAVLTAADPRAAGVEAAVADAVRMLQIDGVVGVNLSGSATAGPETESAAIMSEVATAIRARAPRPPGLGRRAGRDVAGDVDAA